MTSRRGQLWTAIDDAELRELLSAGASMFRIARHLGRTQQAVASRKVRLRIRHG